MTTRVCLPVIASIALYAMSGCAPDGADRATFVFTGSAFLAEGDAPTGGEAILTIRNQSDEAIAPSLVRVDDGADWRNVPAEEEVPVTAIASSNLAPRRQTAGAIAPKVYVDEVRLHLHLEPGTYVVLADGRESYQLGHWIAFEISA